MKQIFIKNNISGFQKITFFSDCKGRLSFVSYFLLLPLVSILLLFSACASGKKSPPPLLQTSSPLVSHTSDTLPHPRKIAPYRYGEDPSIREAKHKYIPREVWDVAGSPDLAKERVYLNKAIKKDPSNYEPLYFLGFNYLEARMLNESAEAFEKVLKLKPDHPLAL